MHQLARVLQLEFDRVETSTPDSLQEGELLTNLLQPLVPLEALVFVGHHDLWGALALHALGENLLEEFVGDQPDDDGDGHGGGTQDDGIGPLGAVQSCDREGSAADEDDHDLTADHDHVDADEEPIALDAFEDVELVIETTGAKGGSVWRSPRPKGERHAYLN